MTTLLELLAAGRLPDTRTLADYLVVVSTRTTLLLVVAAASAQWMRKASAAGRHLVCLLALGGAIVLSLLTIAAPFREVAIALPGLSSWFPTGHAHGAGGSSLSWSVALAWLWIAGSVTMLARYLLGLRLVILEFRRSVPFEDPSWKRDLDRLADRAGVAPSSIALRIGAVASPLTYRVLSPVILLPEAARRWDFFERDTVLLHELAHIRRHDFWANQVANVARALFWFHPLVWILAARLRREQELACDDVVLQAGVAPVCYARLLLNSVRGLSSEMLFGCPMAGQASARILRARFVHLFDKRRARGTNRAHSVRIGILFLTSLLLLSVLHPISAEDVYKVGGEVSTPRVLVKSEPAYTPEAKDAGIEGVVILAIIVGTDGRPRDIRVKKSLDPVLDRNAVAALGGWRFQPAARRGKPVAVRATVEINFRLK